MKRIGEKVLMFFIFIISWAYILGPLMIFSILANIYHLICMTLKGKLKSTIAEKKAIESNILCIEDINVEYSKFTYQYDGLVKGTSIFAKWPTWIPLILVFIYRSKRDNCDGADRYCRWLFKVMGKKSDILKAIKAKQVIYVPTRLSFKSLTRVHYFNIVGNQYELENDKYLCYSNGKVTNETKEQLATRYLKGDNKFLFIKKPL